MNNESEVSGRLDPESWEDAELTTPNLDLSALDVSPTGPMSFAVVCDSAEHPDRRVPYRVSVEAGVAIEDVEPLWLVS